MTVLAKVKLNIIKQILRNSWMLQTIFYNLQMYWKCIGSNNEQLMMSTAEADKFCKFISNVFITFSHYVVPMEQ